MGAGQYEVSSSIILMRPAAHPEAYGVFFGTFLYAMGFIGNMVVPKSLDSAPTAPLGTALAINVALGAREESPDKGGALRTIAEQPFGRGLLTVLALGLAAYALWRLAQGFLDRDNEGEGPKGLAKRGGATLD